MAAVLGRGEGGPGEGGVAVTITEGDRGSLVVGSSVFGLSNKALCPVAGTFWVNASRVLPLLLPSGFPIEHCRLSRQGDFPVHRLPPPEVSSLRIPALFLDVIFPVFSHFENLLQIFVHNFFTFVKCLTHRGTCVDDLSNCCGKIWNGSDKCLKQFPFSTRLFFRICF